MFPSQAPYALTNGDGWVESDFGFLVHTAPQRTEEWLAARKDVLTASNFGKAAGISNFCKTEEDYARLADEITRVRRPARPNAAMKHGTDTEDEAREQYRKARGYNKIIEVGLVKSHGDSTLGCSVDGIITDEGLTGFGIVEIKCPKNKMYAPLLKFAEKVRTSGYGAAYDRYYNHIWAEHRAQMQGQMAITGASWCDYYVYHKATGESFLERLPFDERYWLNYLLPKLRDFQYQHLLRRILPNASPVQNSNSIPSQPSAFTPPAPLGSFICN